MKKSYETAKELAKKYDWKVIFCVKNDKLRTIEEINDEMLEIVLKNL